MPVQALLDALRVWVALQPAIRAAALVGSYARAAATPAPRNWLQRRMIGLRTLTIRCTGDRRALVAAVATKGMPGVHRRPAQQPT